MGMQPANHKRHHECDSCCWQVDGYSRKDLLEEGWFFRKVNTEREFALCDECVLKYENAWATKATA